MMLLANPMSTDRYLSNAVTPILAPKRSAVVIQSNFKLTMRKVVQSGTNMNGFILHDCEVKPVGFYVQDTNCGGNLCDRQQESLGRCACFQMLNRSGCIKISIELEVVCGDISFTTVFRSKWFVEKYILKQHLPIGVTAHTFEDFEVEERFFGSLSTIFSYINNNCKFQAIGWAKRGEMMDLGVAQPSNSLPHNGAKNVVESSNLLHHITKLEPMTPHLLDQETIDSLRFEV